MVFVDIVDAVVVQSEHTTKKGIKSMGVNFMANDYIRAYAKQRKVCLWEIADELGVSDGYFSKLLRKEFSEIKRCEAVEAVDRIISRRGGDNHETAED